MNRRQHGDAWILVGVLAMLASPIVGIAIYLARGDGAFFPQDRHDRLIGWGQFVAILAIVFAAGVHAVRIGVRQAREADRDGES